MIPHPRFNIGDRVRRRVSDGSWQAGFVTGMSYDRIQDFDRYDYENAEPGWWYTVRFDNPKIRELEYRLSQHERYIQRE